MNKKKGSKNQRGAILITLVVSLVIMAVLGSGMLYYSTTSSYGELFANSTGRAYYLGESGANYALQKFNPSTNYTNGPFPTLTTFNISSGQFAVKTYDKPGDPTRLIIEATGIVGSGWLTTRQLVTKSIVKASPGSPGGAPPTAPVGFDLNGNSTLDPSWTPTPGTDVKIVNSGPSGGPALQFKGDVSSINLAWNTPAGQAAGAPDVLAAWNNNGQLLSYSLQVKIKIDRQGSKGQHYMVGLSFRIIDDNNSYGLSFYRANGTNGPSSWWGASAFADFRAHLPTDGKNYAVLWKKVNGTYTVLNYALMDYIIYGNVVTNATAQTLSDYPALFINVNERFDGTPTGSRNNHLKVYTAGPSIYPLGTSNWNFSSFKQITWTWPASVSEVLDQTFTSVTGSTQNPQVFETTRPEIGVHAFYDSNAANDQFFNGFGMAIQGTSTGGGSYQY